MTQLVWDPVDFLSVLGVAPEVEEYETSHKYVIRQPPLRSLLPFGAYKPRWFMSPVHLSPHEAVIAHKQLHSEWSIGIHFGTFRLADDGQDEAMDELGLARRDERVSEGRFRVLGFGEGGVCRVAANACVISRRCYELL